MWVVRFLGLLFAVALLFFGVATQQHHTARIVYTRDQLLDLKPAFSLTRQEEIPVEIWRKTHRGCRGNKKLRRKREALKHQRRSIKPCLPSIIMGNVRSLANKMDELMALAQSQREYRECSVMCFTETWLHQDVPDDNATIRGFHTVRADRDCVRSGKRKGGGLAILVNNRWCNPAHITMKERICGPDVELCAVGIRPYYLPREFSHVIMVAVQFMFPPLQTQTPHVTSFTLQ